MTGIFNRGRTWGMNTITAEPWTAHAACSPKTAEWFWPINKSTKDGLTNDTRAALAICRRCTVKTECAQYAITNGEREGIWGGLTEEQLAQRRAQAGTGPRYRTHTDGDCTRCSKFRELTGNGMCTSCAAFMRKKVHS
jgi:WhiB family redox-sensing transcriptional regulator